MEEIQESSTELSSQITNNTSRMAEVIEVINDIANKTNMINDIVFQTKLLSFNASVEAARAGEHGKGFAIVAEEIGTLATQSGDSAQEIQDLIANGITKINELTDSITKNMEETLDISSAKIKDGVIVAKECEESFNNISELISESNTQTQSVLSNAQSQLASISQINTAVSTINGITHDNLAISDETNSSAATIRNESRELKKTTENVLEIIYGNKKTAR